MPCIPLGLDYATQGNWVGKYGKEGWYYRNNAYTLLDNKPSHISAITMSAVSNYRYTTSNVGTPNLLETRWLLEPSPSTLRSSTIWFAASPWSIDFTVTDSAWHSVSIYLCVPDGAGRREYFDIQPFGGGTSSGSLIATSDYLNGAYFRFLYKGSFRLVASGTTNQCVNGIFFGPALTNSVGSIQDDFIGHSII